MKKALLFALASLFVSLFVFASAQNYSPVTDEMLRNPPAESWLQLRGNYEGFTHSRLDGINVDNVANLVPVWTFSTGVTNGHEAPPIVHGDMMFVVGAFNKLYALEAATGELVWQYERRLPREVLSVACCDVVNRGVTLYNDKLYMGTLDGHVIAFDAMTGQIVWDVTLGDYTVAEIITSPPLAMNGMIISGMNGGEYGVRGYLQAMDAESGEVLWKTYTIPGPGEPGNETWAGDSWQRGGGAPWLTGTYDPDLNMIYYGTGNPSPWLGEAREGDNLYTDSVLALNPDTGEILHYYQRNPHDVWDFDGTNEAVLVDIELDGEMRETAMIADRNGYFYTLDRNDLSFISANPFVTNNTIESFDANGRPTYNEERTPALGKQVFACPAFLGGKNWSSMSYSPDTELMYIPSNEWCMDIKGIQVNYTAGQFYVGAEFEMQPVPGLDYVGNLQAFDPVTGEAVWSARYEQPVWGGVLSTAGNLVFFGTADRYFRAHNAETGEVLWQFRTNSGIVGVPSMFEVDGTQYVAIQSGWGGAIPIWGGPVVERVADVPEGGVIWVFALNELASQGSDDVAQSGE